MSTNFSFLSDTEPELYELVSGAEALAHESPTTTLRELRTFGELLLHRLQEAKGDSVEASTQHDRIVALQENGTLPEEIATALHQIRMQGNDASHENTGTFARAHQQLYNAWTAAVWLHQQIHPGQHRPDSFQRPEPPEEDGTDDEVQAEMEALKERLEAVEGRQEKSSEVERLKSRIRELESEKIPAGKTFRERDPTSPTLFRRFCSRGRKLIAEGGQTIRRAGTAILQASDSAVRFIGRTVRRILKIAATLALLGALLMYFPSIYGTGVQLLPNDTTQSFPTVKSVKNIHAKVLPRKARARVEEIATSGWGAGKKKSLEAIRAVNGYFDLWLRGKGKEEVSGGE